MSDRTELKIDWMIGRPTSAATFLQQATGTKHHLISIHDITKNTHTHAHAHTHTSLNPKPHLLFIQMLWVWMRTFGTTRAALSGSVALPTESLKPQLVNLSQSLFALLLCWRRFGSAWICSMVTSMGTGLPQCWPDPKLVSNCLFCLFVFEI